MIITKRALSRRTMLRGLGVAVALPMLDAMVPALTAVANTAAKPVQRFGFFYMPNGVAMNHTGVNYWKPQTVGADFEFSPILSPLEPFRNQLTVVSGLHNRAAESLGDGNGDHQPEPARQRGSAVGRAARAARRRRGVAPRVGRSSRRGRR